LCSATWDTFFSHGEIDGWFIGGSVGFAFILTLIISSPTEDESNGGSSQAIA
jgi:hypothetical protein